MGDCNRQHGRRPALRMACEQGLFGPEVPLSIFNIPTQQQQALPSANSRLSCAREVNAKSAADSNQAQAVMPWLKVSDSVSSMRSIKEAPAAKYEVRLEGRDRAKILGRLRQLSAQKGSKGTEKDAAPRMLHRWVCSIYRLPPHLNRDHCCSASLGVANDIMGASTLPGLKLGSFLAVSGNSLLFHLGVSWGFTAITIALGSSYFQRLCHVVPSLEWAAQRHTNFAAYAVPRNADCTDYDDDLAAIYVDSAEYQSREMTLKSILFTCVAIASKNVDRVSHPGILQYMLTKIYGVPVTADHVYDVENKCLDGLGWQLGPYYLQDSLEDTWEDWVAEY